MPTRRGAFFRIIWTRWSTSPTSSRLQGAMSAEDEYYTSLLGITELLKYGTTCFLDPGSTKYLDACMQAYEESGCRIVVGNQVVDKPNPLRLPVYTLDEAVQRMEHTIQQYDHARMTEYAPGPCRSMRLFVLTRCSWRPNSWLTTITPVSPCIRRTVRDCADVPGEYGKRPVEYLDDLGLLGPNMLLAHVIDLDDREIASHRAYQYQDGDVSHRALKMGSRMTTTARLPEMVQQGICVSLGTDAGNNSNLIETLRSMYLVTVLYKDARGTTDVVPAELALELATLHGARALGLEDDIGSLEVGKKADLVLFDTRRPEWRTLFNPVNSLVYNADGRSVHTVIVDGRVVVENHRACYVDEEELITQVQALGERLLQRTGIHFEPRWPVV